VRIDRSVRFRTEDLAEFAKEHLCIGKRPVHGSATHFA
jgi:hypothetical protein